jgi:ABC-type sugar transport system ATPase subunit
VLPQEGGNPEVHEDRTSRVLGEKALTSNRQTSHDGNRSAPTMSSVAATAAAPGVAAISLRKISKTFPGAIALDGIDLDINAGEIHGLVGENGAGKSTLLKILTGAHGPTLGTMEVFGEEVFFEKPLAARKAGITAVYQELTVIPAMSAAANVFLGQERRHGPVQDRRAERRRFRELSDLLGVRIDPNARADTLSIADQQSLEIMRGIESAARVLVLDEPTASLTLHEREALYGVMRNLASHGVTLVLISHDLDEVVALTDTITVLRDGRLVASRPTAEWTKAKLIAAMLGEELSMKVSHRRKAGEEVLRAEGVFVPGILTDVSFSVRQGEILGFAGLVGSGRTELFRALAGLDPQASGSIWIDGRQVRWPRSPQAARRLGIALAPEDRKSQGLVLGLPVYDNLNLTTLGRVASGGILMRSREMRRAQQLADRVRLRPPDVRRPARELSGGNQQKIVIGKWLDCAMRVLLVDEPTRGIDVGAKVEIFSLLDELASKGVAVVMVSSELEEVVENSDRVLALAGGRVIHEFDQPGLTQNEVMSILVRQADD